MGQHHVASEEELLGWLLAPDQSGQVLTIDGFDGCGESELAGKIAPLLDAVHIEVDDFLGTWQGSYANSLQSSELRARIAAELPSRRRILIEGVCIKRVMRQLGITETIDIYIKRLDVGCWILGVPLLNCATFEEAMDHRDPEVRPIGLCAGVLAYHFEFRPHDGADCVYTWSALER
jgi:hypothetical protein